MSLIFVLAIVVVGWILYKQYFSKLWNQGKAGQLKIILVGLGLIFLLMAVTGRAHAIFALIGAAMTQVMRFAPLLVRFLPMLKNHLGPAPMGGGGQRQSQVKTQSLSMTLDHETGSLDGTVTAGNYSGRLLSSLELAELRELMDYCNQHDQEAARLLLSYLSRERANEWQQTDSSAGSDKVHGHNPSDNQSGPMDREEAMQILGLEGEVTRQDITTAHRSLMGKFHPDKGGNTYLATKLNTARDVLIGKLES